MVSVPNPVDSQSVIDADIDALADLQWMWRVDKWHRLPSYDCIDFRDALPEWIGLHYESHHAFVARSNTEVVGTAWLAIIERVPTPAQSIRAGVHVQGNDSSLPLGGLSRGGA